MTFKKLKGSIGKQRFTLRTPCFNHRLYVLLNYAEDEFKEFEQRRYKCEWSDVSKLAGMSVDYQCGDVVDYLIWVRDFNWSISSQGVLIHEITHTVIKMLTYHSIPLNIYTQEFLAHFITILWCEITSKIYDIKKHKVKKKK